MKRKVIKSISDSSSSDDDAPRRPKSRRDQGQLDFQKSPNSRLQKLLCTSDSLPSSSATVPTGLKKQPLLDLFEDAVGLSKVEVTNPTLSTRRPSVSEPSSSMDNLPRSESWDALDEDLVEAVVTDKDGSHLVPLRSRPIEDLPFSRDAAESLRDTERETHDRWRGRLWPGKAIISYCRVLTRCQPPSVVPGQKVRLGKAKHQQLLAHWRASDLPTIGTYFESVEAHSSAFFLLIAEESRASLGTQHEEVDSGLHMARDNTSTTDGASEVVDVTEDDPIDDRYPTITTSGRALMRGEVGKNGWLDCEILSIVAETALGSLPQACNDPRLGSVWIVSVAIRTPQVGVADNVNSSRGNNFNNRPQRTFSKESSLSGGDVLILHSHAWQKPLLGIVQPWDPDYDIKFGGSTLHAGATDTSMTNYDITTANVMVCMDGGDAVGGASSAIDSRQSGWAVPGSVFPGVCFSMAVLGNVLTYIRECQALLSLRLLQPTLRHAVLKAPAIPTQHSSSYHGSSTNGPSSSEFDLSKKTEMTSGESTVIGARLPTYQPPAAQDYLDSVHQPPAHVPAPLWRALTREYNASQLLALHRLCRRDHPVSTSSLLDESRLWSPIHLLQGPPGTGKTKTILGIVSVLMSGALQISPKVVKVKAGSTFQNDNNYHGAGTSASTAGGVSSSSSTSSSTAFAPTSWGSPRDPSRPRILLCAPSNTAVDEVCYRLLTQGVLDPAGVRRTDHLKIVRIGNPNREEYGRKTRDTLQNQAFAQQSYHNVSKGGHNKHAAYKQYQSNQQTPDMITAQDEAVIRVVEKVSLENIVDDRRRVLLHMQTTQHLGTGAQTLSASGNLAHSNISNHSSNINHTNNGGAGNLKHADIRRQVLERADIVCCTLSGAGSQPILEVVLRIPGFKFDAVIIDEAAQAVEPSSLIPFKFNPQCVILVGDPCQLPATVFSSAAQRAHYAQSLFERLALAQWPVTMLETQYRMHPAIAAYPAQRFYHQHLHTDSSVNLTTYTQPYHSQVSRRFAPFVFHDVAYSFQQYEDYGGSIMNTCEARYVLQLYDTLIRMYPQHKRNIGIIVPYQAQRKLLLQLFRSHYGRECLRMDTEIATVDGFQGREKDIIIFSCVRAPTVGSKASQSGSGNAGNGGNRSIGFLKDWRRLNVAITRAKYALWLVGHGQHLASCDNEWHALLSYCQAQQAYQYLPTLKAARAFHTAPLHYAHQPTFYTGPPVHHHNNHSNYDDGGHTSTNNDTGAPMDSNNGNHEHSLSRRKEKKLLRQQKKDQRRAEKKAQEIANYAPPPRPPPAPPAAPPAVPPAGPVEKTTTSSSELLDLDVKMEEDAVVVDETHNDEDRMDAALPTISKVSKEHSHKRRRSLSEDTIGSRQRKLKVDGPETDQAQQGDELQHHQQRRHGVKAERHMHFDEDAATAATAVVDNSAVKMQIEEPEVVSSNATKKRRRADSVSSVQSTSSLKQHSRHELPHEPHDPPTQPEVPPSTPPRLRSRSNSLNSHQNTHSKGPFISSPGSNHYSPRGLQRSRSNSYSYNISAVASPVAMAHQIQAAVASGSTGGVSSASSSSPQSPSGTVATVQYVVTAPPLMHAVPSPAQRLAAFYGSPVHHSQSHNPTSSSHHHQQQNLDARRRSDSHDSSSSHKPSGPFSFLPGELHDHSEHLDLFPTAHPSTSAATSTATVTATSTSNEAADNRTQAHSHTQSRERSISNVSHSSQRSASGRTNLSTVASSTSVAGSGTSAGLVSSQSHSQGPFSAHALPSIKQETSTSVANSLPSSSSTSSSVAQVKKPQRSRSNTLLSTGSTFSAYSASAQQHQQKPQQHVRYMGQEEQDV